MIILIKDNYLFWHGICRDCLFAHILNLCKERFDSEDVIVRHLIFIALLAGSMAFGIAACLRALAPWFLEKDYNVNSVIDRGRVINWTKNGVVEQYQLKTSYGSSVGRSMW